MVLVPVMLQPLNWAHDHQCPGCKAVFGRTDVHMVKTIHLWLDDTGSCIVSEGVLKSLRLAGMPGLDAENDVINPPPLSVGPPREQQDHDSRAIWIPTKIKETAS